MIDRWKKALEGEKLSTNFCTLSAWPPAFELTPEQAAELQRPGVADPELEQAIQLTQEGLALALQARGLYEPSCQVQTLADTAQQGTSLALQALDKLSQAQTVIDTIRRRK
jgi:hypothetical protein